MADRLEALMTEWRAPDMPKDPLLAPGQASKEEMDMYAIPAYVRLQIPLRTGRDGSNSSISRLAQYAAELRNLATEMDRLQAEHRTSEIHRLIRLKNIVSMTNHQLSLDRIRKQRHTKSGVSG